MCLVEVARLDGSLAASFCHYFQHLVAVPGNVRGVPAASGMCFWELLGLMLYLVVAVALMALLLRCFWRSLFAYPDILVSRNLWVIAALSGRPDCIGRIKPQGPPPVVSFLFSYLSQDGWCNCVLSASTATASSAV